jgi:hypothetical protein
MLRKRKEEKARRSILETLLRDMQGTAAEKLVLFERLKTAGAFVNEPALGIAEAGEGLADVSGGGKGKVRRNSCGSPFTPRKDRAH